MRTGSPISPLLPGVESDGGHAEAALVHQVAGGQVLRIPPTPQHRGPASGLQIEHRNLRILRIGRADREQHRAPSRQPERQHVAFLAAGAVRRRQDGGLTATGRHPQQPRRLAVGADDDGVLVESNWPHAARPAAAPA